MPQWRKDLKTGSQHVGDDDIHVMAAEQMKEYYIVYYTFPYTQLLKHKICYVFLLSAPSFISSSEA